MEGGRMTAATFVAVTALGWVVLIAIIVAIFHGAKWIDKAIDEEMNVIAGTPSGFDRGAQREE